MEHLLVPYQATRSITARRVLVFAPHPDDEVFGCGGALRHFVEAGIPVRIIVVTDGGALPDAATDPAYVARRQQESLAAAALIGYDAPLFWSHPDRSLEYGERLVQAFVDAIAAWDADLVLAPSLFEVHPDHRASGMAALEAVRRRAADCRLAFYEVGQPQRPNLLLDISAVLDCKRAAMQCFASQLARQRYDEQIEALNRYRAYTLPREVAAAEAFEVIDSTEIARQPLQLFASEHRRRALPGTTRDAGNAPLVSVIVRSMDRPVLAEALDSIAVQTYPNIEVLVVNAAGTEHRPLGAWCGRFPLRLVSGAGPLTRSQAANAGIDAIRGLFFAFLDDDDTLDADHYARLVAAAGDATDLVPYAGVRSRKRRDATGTVLNIFAERWEEGKLLAGNFMPIHAPLVPSALLARGVRFDTAFDVYEDWDFWLQLAQQARFVLCEGVTATYFTDGDSGVNPLTVDHAVMQQATLAIYAKWLGRLGPAALWQVARLYHERNLGQHTCHIERGRLEQSLGQLHETLTGFRNDLHTANVQLDVTRYQLDEARTQRDETHAELDEMRGRLDQTRATLDETRTTLDETRDQLERARADLAGVYNSRSWRITAPLRALISLLPRS